MTQQHIDQLFYDNSYRLDKCLHKSSHWILDEIEDLQREYGEQVSSPGEILYARQWSQSDGIMDVIVPGNFYTFIYDPLLKYTLPYYDIFPLVLVFETGDGWFRGLNFHYHNQQARIQLLGHLMKYATTISPQTGRPTLTGQTRILFDWEKVKDSPASAFVQPIEQKYLMSRAKSGFKYINPFHWVLMQMLPCEQFVKADTLDVWRDTNRKTHAISKERWKRRNPTVDYEKTLQNAVKLIRKNGGIIPRDANAPHRQQPLPLHRLT